MSKEACKGLSLQSVMFDRELQEGQKAGLGRSQSVSSASVLRAGGKECRSGGEKTWIHQLGKIANLFWDLGFFTSKNPGIKIPPLP